VKAKAARRNHLRKKSCGASRREEQAGGLKAAAGWRRLAG